MNSPDRWGIDAYSRYEQLEDGERVAVEPYPGRNMRLKLSHRLWIVQWHIGMIRQHGVREWFRLRAY